MRRSISLFQYPLQTMYAASAALFGKKRQKTVGTLNKPKNHNPMHFPISLKNNRTQTAMESDPSVQMLATDLDSRGFALS